MAAILVHERMRIKEIEYEAAEIRQVRRDINAAHRHITRLATLGDSARASSDGKGQTVPVTDFSACAPTACCKP